MNIEQLRDLALGLKGCEETMPFGDTVVVYKVGGKMFFLIGLEPPNRFTVKCDPEIGQHLIEEYPDAIQPGYHMNKKHWLTIRPDRNLSEAFIKERVHHSYDLVVNSLPKKIRDWIF